MTVNLLVTLATWQMSTDFDNCWFCVALISDEFATKCSYLFIISIFVLIL